MINLKNTKDEVSIVQKERLKLIEYYLRTITKESVSEAEAQKALAIQELSLYDQDLGWLFDRVNELSDKELMQGNIPDFDFLFSWAILRDLTHMFEQQEVGNISMGTFRDTIENISLKWNFVEKYISFGEDFARTLIHQESNWMVYLVCWRPGQCSPLHQHGEETLDAIYVCRGTLSHRLLEPIQYLSEEQKIAEEAKLKEQSQQFIAGDRVFVNRCQYHQLGNLSDEDLVTLHFRVGTPPDDKNWVEENGVQTIQPIVF